MAPELPKAPSLQGWEPAAGSGQVGCGEPAGAGGSSEGQTPVTPAWRRPARSPAVGAHTRPCVRARRSREPLDFPAAGEGAGSAFQSRRGHPTSWAPTRTSDVPPPPPTPAPGHSPVFPPLGPRLLPLPPFLTSCHTSWAPSAVLSPPVHPPGPWSQTPHAWCYPPSACHLPLPVGGSVPPAVSGQWTDTPAILVN